MHYYLLCCSPPDVSTNPTSTPLEKEKEKENLYAKKKERAAVRGLERVSGDLIWVIGLACGRSSRRAGPEHLSKSVNERRNVLCGKVISRVQIGTFDTYN